MDHEWRCSLSVEHRHLPASRVTIDTIGYPEISFSIVREVEELLKGFFTATVQGKRTSEIFFFGKKKHSPPKKKNVCLTLGIFSSNRCFGEEKNLEEQKFGSSHEITEFSGLVSHKNLVHRRPWIYVLIFSTVLDLYPYEKSGKKLGFV